MSLVITVHGYAPGDVTISAGHHTTPDGTPVPVAQRRELVQAAIQALTDQMEPLADDPA